jgi:hypothetical protein
VQCRNVSRELAPNEFSNPDLRFAQSLRRHAHDHHGGTRHVRTVWKSSYRQVGFWRWAFNDVRHPAVLDDTDHGVAAAERVTKRMH